MRACSTSPMPVLVCQAAGLKPAVHLCNEGSMLFGPVFIEVQKAHSIALRRTQRHGRASAAPTDDAHVVRDLSCQAASEARMHWLHCRAVRPSAPVAVQRQHSDACVAHSNATIARPLLAAMSAAGISAGCAGCSRRRGRPAASEPQRARWRLQDGESVSSFEAERAMPTSSCFCLRGALDAGQHQSSRVESMSWLQTMGVKDATVRQVPDARERYKQLLFYAKKLPPMPAEEHTDDNKVKGCVSQVGGCSW